MNYWNISILYLRLAMELTDLYIFRTVAREGGITRAAEKLNRVQSNVTTRVRQFEEKLGVDLFVRTGKRLTLSPAGNTMLAYADRMLDLAAEAQNAVTDRAPRGPLRLGAMESTAAIRLPAALAEFSRRFPKVTIELRTGNTLELGATLLAGDVDAIFAGEPLPEGPFDTLTAYVEELVVVTARNVPLDGPPGSPSRVMLAFEHGCPHRMRLEEWFESRAVMPERIVELGSWHAVLGCAAVGMGVALLPRVVVDTIPDRAALRLHELPDGRNRARTLLAWRKGVTPPNVEALASLYREGSAI
ncbi:LysR substrate-binding domain-containing protein [Oricola cellulosilytica]|nr:LysR substrate-binding domain-containing protein [Oricola cellulosilytica]